MEEVGVVRFVCSRGVSNACRIHISPESTDVSRIKPGDSVYVCCHFIPTFAKHILPHIPCPFVLVSGDGRLNVPFDVFFDEEDFQRFIESPNILRWFVQNAQCVHPKIVQLPVGFDAPLRGWSAPIHLIIQCYADFHLSDTRLSKDRLDAIAEVPAEVVFYSSAAGNPERYAFVLCPRGTRADSHRIWKSFSLGCIPVVKSGVMDPLFIDLPILIVKKWSDITLDLLETTLVKFARTTFSLKKLTLDYWVRDIHAGQRRCRNNTV